MKRYTHVIQAVYNRPWAIEPQMLLTIDSLIRMRVAGGMLREDEIRDRIEAQSASYGDRLGAQDVGGLRIIPLYGVITQRAGLLSDYSGGVSLGALSGAITEALADSEVSAVVLDVDSPGGSVDGLTEFAAWLRKTRDASEKPIVAIANQQMTSAAYYVAAQTHEIVASPSALVGGIGTVALHMEHSKADEAAGEAYTLIASDPRKLDGNEFQPISSEHQADMQRRVDAFARMFVNDVAKGRGITAGQVASDYSGGAVLLAGEALKAKQVDRVESLTETVSRLTRRSANSARRVRAEGPNLIVAFSDVGATAHGVHHTPTSDAPWDGPANEARCPAEAGPLRAAHAWSDPDGDADAKSSHKFIHHEISADGRVGAANLNACSNGRAVLKGGRGGTNIPAADKSGVWNHLAAHERDADRDVPAYSEESPASETLAAEPTPPPGPVPAEHIAAITRPAAARATWAADLKEHIRHGTAGPQQSPVGRRARRLPRHPQRQTR